MGVFLGAPLTVGCLIGESSAGWVSNLILNTYARRHDGYRKVEVRLWLLPLTSLCPIGTAMVGYCIQHHKPWIQDAVCMAVAEYRTQVIATVVYTYFCDAYKPQSSETNVIINVFQSREFSSRHRYSLSNPNRRYFDPKTYNIPTVYAFNIGFYYCRQDRPCRRFRAVCCNQCIHASLPFALNLFR